MALVGLLVACGPASWTRVIDDRRCYWRDRLRAATLRLPLGILIALAIIALGASIRSLSTAWQLPTRLDETDQGAYLETAQQVFDQGGIIQLLLRLYRGEFTEVNRHPFYLGLLSLTPTVFWGKVLSTLAVVIAVLGTVIHVGRSRSGLAGVIVLILAAVNFSLAKASVMIGCEGWLMLWLSAAWWLLDSRPASTSNDATSSGQVSTQNLKLLGAGICLGLGWLTKGTALPLLPLAMLWVGGRQYWLRRNFLVATTAVGVLTFGWLAVAHPLVVRNVTVYGSPFHNVNSWLLFVDQFEDPAELSREFSLGKLAAKYWHSHTFTQMLAREVEGLIWEVFISLRVLGAGTPISSAQ